MQLCLWCVSMHLAVIIPTGPKGHYQMLHGGQERHITLETHSWIMLQLLDSVQHVLWRHMKAGQGRARQERASPT